MDFFDSDKGRLPVTEEDKDWIEENFEWLIQSVGVLTLVDSKVIDKTDKLFNMKTPEEISERLCEILEIDPERITIKTFEDIRSKTWTVIAPMGEFEDITSDYREYEKDGEIYLEISIAKSLLNNPALLISTLAYELSRLKLKLMDLPFETGPDTGVFLYLAAIYFGFGLFISNSVFVNEKGWISQSNISLEVVGYSLAFYYWLKNDKGNWKDNISSYIKPHFESSLKYIEENPPEVFNQGFLSYLIQVSRIEKITFECYDNGEYEKAIELNKELEDLDPESPSVANNSGYFKLRLKRYQEAIEDFNRSINLDPEFPFAYNNLGFAYLMINELEKGYHYINKSLLIEENNSYAYRNLGIYYKSKLDFDSAYQNFETALRMDPKTELIHFYYGMAMLENGDYLDGIEELKLSAEDGEEESINKLKEIKTR